MRQIWIDLMGGSNVSESLPPHEACESTIHRMSAFSMICRYDSSTPFGFGADPSAALDNSIQDNTQLRTQRASL